jgi:Ca2+-binding RTX toxin-like protein
VANISGGTGDDTLRGVAGEENSIAGNDGNDKVVGRGKSDLLLGNKGNDVVKGANGHDVLFGGQGDDTLNGGNGADWLSGDQGDDTLIGGNGDDTFAFNGNTVGGVDTIMDFDVGRSLRKMTFNDKVELTNFGGADFNFVDKCGDAELYVDGALIAVFKNVSAKDVLLATEFKGFSPGKVDLNGVNEIALSGTIGDDVITGIPGMENTIAGNSGNDEIYGHGKSDFLLGNGGNDVLEGRNAPDTLYGGGGDDTLNGGSGNDLLNGDVGSDTLTGGSGGDTFQFKVGNAGVDTVTDFDTAEGDKVEITGEQAGTELGFSDGVNGAEMTLNGQLAAIFEGATAAEVQGSLINYDGTFVV